MKFSELWLREWINPPVNINILANKITVSGLKVDNLEPVSSYFNNVIIGSILDIKAHPNDCNLQINIIDIGSKNFFNIISESKKFKKNLRVAVALSNSKLYGDIRVEPVNIQGELSEGVLCSFSSLGMTCTDEVNNIIELPLDAPLGEDLKKYLQFNDNVIDISITPNRGDCLSVMGIARDIAAIYRLSSNLPKIDSIVPNTDDEIPIFIDDPYTCPSYFSRIIKNIDVSVSTPLWMKERLRRCGIQVTNVIMDIVNYVLLELGQPIHIFDLDTIFGKINIRLAKKGEKLRLPYNNKNEIILTSDILIVADQINPIGIAGVLVGHDFSVNISKTSNIFLESAFFNSSYITKSSRQYGLVTYSSYRYERQGVNPNISKLALERITFLLINICGGKSGKVMSVIHNDLLPKKIVIVLHRYKLDKLLGHFIRNDEIIDILIHLGCDIKQEKDYNLWEVLIPIWRFDIKIEEDLIEEIIRLYGYDKIRKVSISSTLNINKKPKNVFSLSRSKTFLVDLGYQEVITYSFVDPEMQKLLYPDNQSITLLNPLASDMSVMRLSLLVGLLKVLLYNNARQQKNIRLFECGECFILDENNINKMHQKLMLSGIITGDRFDEHWDTISNMLNFYDIKGDVESLLEINGKLNDVKFKHQVHPALHPGQSAAIILKKEHVGFVGAIHPIIEKKLNLQNQTFAFELLWEKISHNKKISRIVDIPKFPISRRDISIIVSDNISSEEIVLECKKIIQEKLIDIKLFDVYKGKEIAEGFRSLSIGLYIYHWSRTLQEDEISSIVSDCISVLQKKFKVFLRKK